MIKKQSSTVIGGSSISQKDVNDVKMFAGQAELAATAANISGKVYATPADGVDPVTGVSNGAYFNVRSSSDESYVDEYQNVGGVAVATGKSYLSALGVQLQDKPASTIRDASGKDQQELNDKMFRPNTGTPYFRTIFEFMPKNVIADVLGAHILDHTDYVEAAINALGVGGILWLPLNNGQLNISRSIKITGAHKSIKIVGSSGTASRDSSLSTFKWIGPENGGIMFDILQSWGITFEDVSFHGNDKATNIIRIRAEGDGLPVRPSHRHNFVRCGFGSTYNQLVVIGDGGNEDVINVKFDSCQFDYYHNATAACEAGILIDAPQGYCFDFTNCLFARGGYPLNFFHLKAGSVSVTSATFDGNVGSVDFYIDPYNGSISPQLTVTHAETQSDWFLKTASGAGKFATRMVLLQNIRHRADNGQVKPMSIYWDLGHQCQLVHIACALHGIDVGPNAASVVEVAPQWGRTGGNYPITGYEGNTSVVNGLNGFNITESNRTAKGGLRVGENLFAVGGGDANNQPLNLTGNKLDGDFWINTKSSLAKSKPVLYRYASGGAQVLASDGVVHQQYTSSVVANAGKFDYSLDLQAVPQVYATYEVRWSVLADKVNSIWEMGVFHVFVRRRGTVQIVKVDVSKVQEATPIITTGVSMFNPTTQVESGVVSASQSALDANVIRLKFLGALAGDLSGDDLKVSVRRIGH